MKRILLLISAFLLIFPVFSQQKGKVKKDAFFVTELDFNESFKSLKKGTRLFNKKQKGSYFDAIDYLTQAYKYNPDYAMLNYELGVSYLKIHDNKLGLKYLENAMLLNSSLTKDMHFWLARAYHLNAKFDLALQEYETYLNSIAGKQEKHRREINKYMAECRNGIELFKNPKPLIIDNLGSKVNTRYPEYSPVFASFDSIVFFASRQPNTTGGKKNKKITNDYFEDIYYTSCKNGVWETPDKFKKPINLKGNDAPVSVNPNGEGLLIYRGNKGNGDIFITFRKIRNSGKITWTKPKQVIRKVNKNKSRETTLTFSHDSSTVYFVSNRKKGVGAKDIWVIHRRGNSNNGWTRPQNLGRTINTIYDEESVFLLDNDSVLYFSSKGHNSMGGFDLFRTIKLPDGRWTEPENLGTPFNTPDDDMFIFVNKDKKTGYFATNGREDKIGDFDLYWFFLYRPKSLNNDGGDDLIAYIKKPVNELYLEEPVSIKTMKMTVLKGFITEYETNKPLSAKIEIVDNKEQKVVNVIETNATTGAYTVMLPSGKDYGFAVVADGYMFYSENFNIPAATGYNEIEKNIQLLPINPGARVVLRNVFFDTGKSTLRPESYPELQRIADAFKLYPKLIIEISGHTDNRGKDALNNKLSQARAQSVVDYLISIGVPAKQLIAKGYGKIQPIADNKTEAGRQLNRRVEAKIISF